MYHTGQTVTLPTWPWNLAAGPDRFPVKESFNHRFPRLCPFQRYRPNWRNCFSALRFPSFPWPPKKGGANSQANGAHVDQRGVSGDPYVCVYIYIHIHTVFIYFACGPSFFPLVFFFLEGGGTILFCVVKAAPLPPRKMTLGRTNPTAWTLPTGRLRQIRSSAGVFESTLRASRWRRSARGTGSPWCHTWSSWRSMEFESLREPAPTPQKGLPSSQLPSYGDWATPKVGVWAFRKQVWQSRWATSSEMHGSKVAPQNPEWTIP